MKDIDLPVDGARLVWSREAKIASLHSCLTELWPSKVLDSCFCTPVGAAFEAGVQKPHLRLGFGTGSLNTKLGLLWAPYLSSLIGFFAHPGQVLPHIAALGARQCSPEMDFWLCFPV